MCSVLGCDSWRRKAQRFNIPEDPETRLEWVEFLLEANEHQVKESSWTDITICREHFTKECFKNVAPKPAPPQLKCGAVPTVSVKYDDDEPPESGTCEEVKTDDDPKNKDLPDTIYLSDGESPSEEEEEKDNDRDKAKTDDNPKNKNLSDTIHLSDDESPSEEEEDEDYDRDVNSDEDWSPTEDMLLAEGHSGLSEEESEDDDEKEEKRPRSGGLKRLCTDCGTFYFNLKRHKCEHKSKPFSCVICGKRCVNELSLKNHSRIHDETHHHPCKYCNLNFQTKLDKRKHEEIHQNKAKPYKCLHCPETFSHSKKRRIHQSQHGGRELIKCKVCGLAFYNDYHLLRHSLSHTGETPYKCAVCERGFKQASHLKSHMRLHTGERPYKCQHCDKGFNHNVSLKSHIQRFHRSTSGAKSNGNKRQKERNAADADINCNNKGSDSEEDNEERKHNTGKEVQKKSTKIAKRRWKTSGRPKGRPKKSIEVSNSRTIKPKVKS